MDVQNQGWDDACMFNVQFVSLTHYANIEHRSLFFFMLWLSWDICSLFQDRGETISKFPDHIRRTLSSVNASLNGKVFVDLHSVFTVEPPLTKPPMIKVEHGHYNQKQLVSPVLSLLILKYSWLTHLCNEVSKPQVDTDLLRSRPQCTQTIWTQSACGPRHQHKGDLISCRGSHC